MNHNTPRAGRFQLAWVMVLTAVFVPHVAGAASGKSPSMRALIEQALDQQVDLEIAEQPLSSAFELIGEKTGVKLTIRPQAVELLPYGSKTIVSAKLKNVSLRQGLVGMLSNLAMTFHVRESDVAIEPTEPLRRICRRATWTELRQLKKLMTTPWSDDAVKGLQMHFQIRTGGDVRKELMDQAARDGTGGTIAEVLEAACDQLDWAWYPWDNSIVVLTEVDQAARFVDKPISVKYNHAALGDVLADLARQADLRLRLEPGVLKGLPEQTQQNFSLMMREATIRTALEMISGATGLAYEVTPKEIVIKHTNVSRTAATQQATVIQSSDPIVGEIHVQGKDGMSYSFWIRQSDLPPDVNEWRKGKIKEVVQQMKPAPKP